MSARRPLVIGNWKMNHDFVEALHLTQQLGVLVKNHPLEHTDVVLCPPFVDLRTVSSVIESERFHFALGAQHVSQFESGAHTGEISVSMLARLGVRYVIVGHSERRQHYAMSDEVVSATLRSVVRAGQHAVLCVGEDGAMRESGEYESFVATQMERALRGLDETCHALVTLAYEPLWAIGTGVNATADQVRAMTEFVRTTARGVGLTEPQVLYGGSVNPENAASLVRDGEVDGFLVGGASLRADAFAAILSACDDCYARKR